MNWWRRKKRNSLKVGERSAVGQVRSENQDACAHLTDERDAGVNLCIVADGMGGHDDGREASTLAVEIVGEVFFEMAGEPIPHRLQRSLEAANVAIWNRSNGRAGRRMGTTCTTLALNEAGAFIAHAGDSRAYRITRKRMEQLTQDHTVVQEMMQAGILTEDEAAVHPKRNALTRALGMDDTIEVDVLPELPLQARDRYLLCSDGLLLVDEQEIYQIVREHTPQEACDQLVARANERGGHDNITAMVIALP